MRLSSTSGSNSASGQDSPRDSRASASSVFTTVRQYFLLSYGTQYHGASSVEVRVKAIW